MNNNEKEIRKYIGEYKSMYMDRFSVKPKSWFVYLQWLSSFSVARNFNSCEIDLVKDLLDD